MQDKPILEAEFSTTNSEGPLSVAFASKYICLPPFATTLPVNVQFALMVKVDVCPDPISSMPPGPAMEMP